ncbi:TPA: glycosyltransferase, partial [Escherichia coli]|nr:glycosyltransferase [Escherichia coli]
NETNKKQMYSKNRGIEIAKGKYIFFGDDDSYLLPGVISRLLATKYETGADVIGARILYMNNNEKTIEDCINRHKKEGRFVSDLNRLDFSYTCDLDHPI